MNWDSAEGREGGAEHDPALAELQSKVESLIYRYRDIGHLLSCTDPLAACPMDHPLLELEAFGLRPADMKREFVTNLKDDRSMATLQDIVTALKDTYCKSIGVEYMHLQDPEEREWLRSRMEPVRNRPETEDEVKKRVVNLLYQAALFEAFLNRKFTGQTRFSLEGAEALIPMLDELVRRASSRGCDEIVLGMAHRGRLNVQVNILQKPFQQIFREFASSYDADSLVGAGDVKYHNGYLTDISWPDRPPMRIFLVNNPSHLEAMDPVAEGIARGRQELAGDKERQCILPILIHGDAAFAGQGVVMETLNLSQLDGYATGGTVHVVINNQIGYTTLPEDARSTRYSTDVAKMLMVPIFHVHGEDPEAVLHVIKLAFDYRMAYGKDVVIDLICYRRYGHNEGDEPYFTQPLMYDRIRERLPVNKMYAERLVESSLISEGELERIEAEINRGLEEAFDAVQEEPGEYPKTMQFEKLGRLSWTLFP